MPETILDTIFYGTIWEIERAIIDYSVRELLLENYYRDLSGRKRLATPQQIEYWKNDSIKNKNCNYKGMNLDIFIGRGEENIGIANRLDYKQQQWIGSWYPHGSNGYRKGESLGEIRIRQT